MRAFKFPAFATVGLGVGVVLLWCRAVLAEFERFDRGTPAGWPWALALLGLVGLTAAAARPDRWASGLSARWGAEARVLLPLGLGLGAVPLGVAMLAGLQGATAAGRLVALAGALAALFFLARRGWAFVGSLRRRSLSGLTFAALLLSGVSLAAGGLGLRKEGALDAAEARRRFIEGFPGVTEITARSGAKESPRGASQDIRAVSHVSPSQASSSFSVGSQEVPASVLVACLGHGCHVELVWADARRSNTLLPHLEVAEGALVTARFDPSRKMFLLSSGDRHQIVERYSSHPLALPDYAHHLAAPRLWLLGGPLSLGLLLGLLALRSRARGWAEAIAGGVEARVEGSSLLLPGGREAPAPVGLREGPVVVLGASFADASYRAVEGFSAEVVLAGRRGPLAEKARLNGMVLDAWALSLSALLATPCLVALAVGLVLLCSGRARIHPPQEGVASLQPRAGGPRLGGPRGRRERDGGGVGDAARF